MTKEELVQRVFFEAKVTSGDARKGQLGPENGPELLKQHHKLTRFHFILTMLL